MNCKGWVPDYAIHEVLMPDEEKKEPEPIKRADIKELRKLGLIFEINRTVLHPLGLALEVTIHDDGTEELSGVWDCRDDPEGVAFGDDTWKDGFAKLKAAQEWIQSRIHARYEALGYVVQGGGFPLYTPCELPEGQPYTLPENPNHEDMFVYQSATGVPLKKIIDDADKGKKDDK
jgi:hypothetical protein